MGNDTSPGGAPAPPAPGARRWATWVLLVTAVAAGAAGAYWWWRPAPPPLSAADDEDDILEPPAAEPGYVGPQACAACHAARAAHLQGTRHFLACCPPAADLMPAGFAPGRGAHPTRFPGLRFEMTRSGGDFIQTAIRSTPAGEERTAAHIDLVYGAGGGNDEVYFTWHGQGLYELPVAWPCPADRWGNTARSPPATGGCGR